MAVPLETKSIPEEVTSHCSVIWTLSGISEELHSPAVPLSSFVTSYSIIQVQEHEGAVLPLKVSCYGSRLLDVVRDDDER